MGESRATVVIAAAGSGQRLGAGGPKAFVEIAGRTLLEWCLRAASAAESVESIVIAAPPGPDALAEAERIAGTAALPTRVIAGGETRADSVRLSLEQVETPFLLVHDAARPLAEPALFDAVAARLAANPEADAVIAAAQVADTIKRSRDPHRAGEVGYSSETVDRSHLWAAQTPQGFRAGSLRRAQAEAAASGHLAEATDEARLIELAGGTVLLEPAPATNFKVTTAPDRAHAEALLAAIRRV